MAEIMVAIGAGAIAGYFKVFKRGGRFIAGPVATAGVVMLLFLMGAKIGANKELMGNLAVMGLEALVFAVIAIMGSTLLVWLWQRFAPIRQTKEPERGRLQ